MDAYSANEEAIGEISLLGQFGKVAQVLSLAFSQKEKDSSTIATQTLAH